MLELIKSHDTPRVYQKQMVLVDGKYVEETVDVTPAHPPSRRLIVLIWKSGWRRRELNIAATQIQKIVRGILGRKYVASFVPNNAATNIQRVVRGRWGRRRAHRRLIFETNRKSATKIQCLLRKAHVRMEFSKLLLSERHSLEATSRQLGELLPCSARLRKTTNLKPTRILRFCVLEYGTIQ